MFVTPEVFINIFLDALIYIFLAVTFFIAIKVVRYFDINQDTPLQYALERQAYLASTIIEFALFFKIILLFYFIYTLDKLSNIIPGAMCAAGVVTANTYGVWLLLLKLLNIYLFGIWLVINKEDLLTKDYRYTKLKFRFFLLIFIAVSMEFALEYLFFNALDVSKIVSCCGVLFNPVRQSAMAMLLQIRPLYLVALFYLNFLVLFIVQKRLYLFAALSASFLFVSLLAIIEFFSPYIYQLPTHHCPFCFLQKEYHYVGYLLYLLLFLGTFIGVAAGVKKALGKNASVRYALFFDTLFVLVVSAYVVVYYLKNGVWLF